MRGLVLLALLLQVGCAHDPIAFELNNVQVPRGGFAIGSGATVEAALRRAFSVNAPSEQRPSQARVDVMVDRVWVGLDQLSDPQLGPGQYRAVVRLSARVDPEQGRARTVRAVGEANTVTPAGPLDMLEGHLRLALERAAERAAERLAYRVGQAVARSRKAS